VHHLDSFLGIATLCSFSGQHNTISTVQNSIGNVRDFGTGRTRVVGHGFEHLGGADDRLTSHVALCNHHLLSDEDLGCRNFDTQISTSNHHSICFLQDLVKIVDALLILDLGNDLDLLSVLTKNFADVFDIVCSSNKRCEHHVHLVLDAKLEISNVLVGQRRQIDISAWKVDTFLRGDLTIVQRLDTQSLVVDYIDDLEGLDAVVNVDELASVDDLCDIFVVNIPSGSQHQQWKALVEALQVLVIASSRILVVSRNVQLSASLDRDIGISGCIASADLRSFLILRSVLP
jgi:hypothetical protein